MGSQTVVPGLWAGDQAGALDGLQRGDPRGPDAPAMSGFPTWGSDVGGYSLGGPDRRRLRALGAARRGLAGHGGRRHRAERDAVDARPGGDARAAATRPSCTTSSSRTSTGCSSAAQPVLRPLGYAYPDDPEAWQADLELLVGPDLLAAPVTGGGHDAERLPADGLVGRPLHRADREGRPGRSPARRRSTQLPLYAASGAVVPFNLRTADSWWGVTS